MTTIIVTGTAQLADSQTAALLSGTNATTLQLGLDAPSQLVIIGSATQAADPSLSSVVLLPTSGLTATNGFSVDVSGTTLALSLSGSGSKSNFRINQAQLLTDTIDGGQLGFGGANSIVQIADAASLTDALFASGHLTNVNGIQLNSNATGQTVTLGANAEAEGIDFLSYANISGVTVDLSGMAGISSRSNNTIPRSGVLVLAGPQTSIKGSPSGLDIYQFHNADFGAADTIQGQGSGFKSIRIDTAATITDAEFANVSDVQGITLDFDAAGQSVVLGAQAQAAGITSIAYQPFLPLGTTNATFGYSVDASAMTRAVAIQGGLNSSAADTLIGATATGNTFQISHAQMRVDSIFGGAQGGLLSTGSNGIKLTDAAAVTDADFANGNFSRINTLILGATTAGQSVVLGTAAVAEGIDQVNVSGISGAIVDLSGMTGIATRPTSGPLQPGVAVHAGPGVSITGSPNGNDNYSFNSVDFTAADTIAGTGTGFRNITFTSAATVTDASFAHVSNVQGLALNVDAAGQTVVLGSLAQAAGITSIGYIPFQPGVGQVAANFGYSVDASAMTRGVFIRGGGGSAADTLIGAAATGNSFQITHAQMRLDSISGGTQGGAHVGSGNFIQLSDASSVTDTDFAGGNFTHINGLQLTSTAAGQSIVLGTAAVAEGIDQISYAGVAGVTVDLSGMTGIASRSSSGPLRAGVGIVAGAATSIKGSANGNDVYQLHNADFTAADTIQGQGTGFKTIAIDTTATVTDSAFANVSDVQSINLAFDAAGQSIVLGGLAQAAGITTVVYKPFLPTGTTVASFGYRVDASAMTRGLSIQGSNGSGNDTLIGSSGDDTISLGLGSDSVDGGGGTNKVVLVDTRASYTVNTDNSGITTLIDNAAGHLSTTVLTHVQQLQFSDQTITLTAPAAVTVTLQPAVSLTTGSGTRSVTIADVNGDGKPDVIAGNGTVLLGNGSGTFTTAQTGSLGGTSVAVGDFNHDGKPDLVVADFTNVDLLLGNGDGTFQSAVPFGAGNSPCSLVVADFNGDGKPDVAVSDFGATVVSLLRGNGDGTFQTAQMFTLPSGSEYITAADLNGDGKLDLITGNGTGGTVSVLLGNGDGTFQTQHSYFAGSNITSVGVGDFNGDGIKDLAVADLQSNGVAILLGNGDGTFGTPSTFSAGNSPDAIRVADIDGDGKLDLVVANQQGNTLSILLGVGDGTFQPQQTFASGTLPVALAVGDVNGDGKIDIFSANTNSNDLSLFLNGTPSSQFTVPTGPSSITGSSGADTIVAAAGTLNAATSIDGGAGTNTLELQGPGAFDLSAPAVLTNIQRVVAIGSGPDTVTLRGGLDVAYGASNLGDTVTGGNAHDTIFGGTGNDSLTAGGTGTWLIGNGGTDTLNGSSAGGDTLLGGIGNDRLISNSTAGTANFLIGKEGLDSGNDTLIGGAGHDTLVGHNGNDSIVGGNGGNYLIGGYPGSLGNPTLVGGTGDDTIVAAPGASSLSAGGGNDFLVGEGGNDTIVAGVGSDTIFGHGGLGGSDANVYIVGPNETVLIADFANTDRIDVSAYHFATFTALQAAAAVTVADNGIIVTLSSGLTLSIVGETSLHSSDFIL